MTQAPVAISTEVKNNALFKYPVVTSRSFIYINFPHKTPESSRKHHNSQTSRKYYQVDNFQDIYKLTVTVSFTEAYEKVCKNITEKNSQQLGPVDQKEFNRGHYTGLFKFGGVHWEKLRERKKVTRISTLEIISSVHKNISRQTACGFVNPSIHGYLIDAFKYGYLHNSFSTA